MTGIAFTKMHGLGNDFVVVDGRDRPLPLTPIQVRAVADRHTGVGCDLLIVVEPARSAAVDAFMRFYNADGGEVSACGNGTRCVAQLLMDELGRDRVRLETHATIMAAARMERGLIAVDMGTPRFDWQDIPLALPENTLHVDLIDGPLHNPAAVNMGNPHAVFFVADAEDIDLERYGPGLETHRLFPERANIGIAQIITRRRIRLRVWERGVGITLACGTGACAAAVTAHRRGLTERAVDVVVDGGVLAIEWREDDHVMMTGPVATSFAGTMDRSLLS
ncbi:MAG: diaminopimelate epimerase [Alphaproteobacteria bacterium]|nr:diaminopimelate epimerase [Alphaproteobacteria bacterium]